MVFLIKPKAKRKENRKYMKDDNINPNLTAFLIKSKTEKKKKSKIYER